MSNLSIRAIPTRQEQGVNEYRGKKTSYNDISLVDVETGEALIIRVPVVLDEKMLLAPCDLVFSGYVVRSGVSVKGKAWRINEADTVTGSLAGKKSA